MVPPERVVAPTEVISVRAMIQPRHRQGTSHLRFLEYSTASMREVLPDVGTSRKVRSGKRLRLNGPDGPFAEIIGVAKQSKYVFPIEPPIEYPYLPFSRTPPMP
jgi:hypothetical protein